MKETGTAARAWINPTESEQKAETQIHRPSFRLISGLENTAPSIRAKPGTDGQFYNAFVAKTDRRTRPECDNHSQ